MEYALPGWQWRPHESAAIDIGRQGGRLTKRRACEVGTDYGTRAWQAVDGDCW
jgi:hypothetical protein